MNIFIIGQTSLHWGRMEFGNIGNYYIIEPLIRELHNIFPTAKISTTLQMSNKFCDKENLQVVPVELYYDLSSNKNLKVVIRELDIVEDYLKSGNLKESTEYIDKVLESDIVIDFSGDIWGDNADFLGKDRFEVGLYKDLIAQKLKKPTFMIAGSPGPFNNPTTKALAKTVFEGFTKVTNREPISTNILKDQGFNTDHVVDLACPAFLFEPVNNQKIKKLIAEEQLIVDEVPTVGFILCGWNFLTGPFDKWPREDSEYLIFAEAIEFMTNTLGLRVCLMSHSNGFPLPPNEFELIHGRDYPIIKQLQRVINERGIAKNVFALDGVYDTWTTKAIISNFDMLVSGRVHAAVAGFSQLIPTVVIDYGHEPKAHKLVGFATVAGQERFVGKPDKKEDLIKKIEDCWNNRNEVIEDLRTRIPIVQEKAKENFRVIKNSLLTEK